MPPEQFLDRRSFAEGERAFGERSQRLDEGIGDDARGAVEYGVDAELVHLLADAHADRGQAAEIDNVGIESLDLGKLGGEVLLIAVTPNVPTIFALPMRASASLKYSLCPLP